VLDAKGKVVSELAKSDLTKFDSLGLKKVEIFTYLAAEGRTENYEVPASSFQATGGER
jgi:dipeptidyl-peptidase 4